MQQIPACFIKLYGRLRSICCSSLGFIPHSPTVVDSCGVPCTQIACEVCVLSLPFVGCLHRNLIYVCTLGLCEVVVAGNWECEIAYLQTSSLAWIAKGDSKHVHFLPAVLSLWPFLLVLESYFYQYKLSCFPKQTYIFFPFFPQGKLFRIKHS